MAAFAIVVRLVTVIGASAMDRAGWRGPADVLLGRLASGTAGRPTPVGTLRSRTAEARKFPLASMPWPVRAPTVGPMEALHRQGRTWPTTTTQTPGRSRNGSGRAT